MYVHGGGLWSPCRAGSRRLSREWMVVLAVGSLLLLIPVSSAQVSSQYSFSNYRLSTEPRDALVVGGSGLVLNCSTQLSDDTIIEWYRYYQFIQQGGGYRYLPSGALEILPEIADEDLEGIYYCTIFNSELGLIQSRKAHVTLATLGQVTSPFGVTIYPGDTARFECNATGTAPKVTTWLKDRQTIDMTEERYASRYTLLPSGALEIQDVRATDAGSYRCRVESPLLPNERLRSTDAELVVRRDAPPINRPEDLAFLVQPGPDLIEALIGSTLTLEAATTEPATLTWYKGEKQIVPDGSHYKLLGQGSLQITNLGEIDTGIYRVVATSTLDNSRVESVIQVLVQVPPEFSNQPRNTYARMGSTTTLPCRVYGIPFPSVEWTRHGQDLSAETEDFLSIDSDGLTIRDVTVRDSGMYQCFANNPWGNIQATAQLIVIPEGVPIPVIRTTPQPQPPVRTPPPTLPRVLTTVAPEGPPAGPVPSAPLEMAAVNVQSQSITLSWQRPTQIPGSLEAYRLYLLPNQVGARVRTVEVNENQLSKTVTDLIPNLEYRIWVRAVNGNGAGAESDYITVTTLDDTRVTPDEVTDIRTIPLSSTSIELSWRPPFDTYGDLERYIIRVTDDLTGSTFDREVQPTETRFVLDNLDVYTLYEMKIIPYNANGAGGTSIVNVRTPGAQPSAAPSNVSVNPAPSIPNALDIAWAPPPITHRHGAITQYKLRYRTKDGEAVAILIPGDLTSFRLAGLQRETGYEVKLAMININGTGPFTEWHPGRTATIEPNTIAPGQVVELDVPYGLVAEKRSAGEVFISWIDPNPPSATPGIVRHYTVAYKRRNDNQFLYANASESSFLVGNLRPFTYYDFQVMAVDGNKISEYSVVANAQTAAALPDSAPQELTIKGFANTSASVSVSWQPPLHANGEIIRYILFYAPDGTTNAADWTRQEVNGESLTTFVHDLKPDSDYAFQIRAENTVGVGPLSEAVVHRTQGGDVSYPVSDVETPWWLWLAIAAACLFLIALAIALLLCIVCGCCRCCEGCCPGCASLCDDIYACCEPCGSCLAGCASGCCPCCCEDEDDCARCWTKCCCGVPCCVCCGKAYKERRAKAELTGYKAVANGKVIGATNTTQVEGNPPDLWADELVMKSMSKNVAGTPSEMESLNKLEIESETQFSNHAQHQQVSERYIPLRSQTEESLQRSGGGAAKYAHVNKGQSEKPNVNINTTNVRIEEIRNEYQGNDAYSTLGSMHSGSQGTRTRHDSDSQHSTIGYHNGQIVTFPDSTITRMGKPHPMTITYEETTTTHSVEKMVPQMDGSNVKTLSSNQTFSKSYSTSDAASDRNLQNILQDGLDRGPLAIEVPATSESTLKAITAPTVSSLNEQANFSAKYGASLDGGSMSTGHNQRTLDRGYNYNTMDSQREYNYNTLDSGVESGREQMYPSLRSNRGGLGLGLGHVENSSYEETEHIYIPDHSSASPAFGRSAISPSSHDSPATTSPLSLGSTPPPMSPMISRGMTKEPLLSTSAMTLPATSRLNPDGNYKSGSSYQFRSTSNIDDLHKAADASFPPRLRSSSTMSGVGANKNKWYLGQTGSAFSPKTSGGMEIDRETSFANSIYSGTNTHATSTDFATGSGAMHASLSSSHHDDSSAPISNGAAAQKGNSYQSNSYRYESHGSGAPAFSGPSAGMGGPLGGVGAASLTRDVGGVGSMSNGMTRDEQGQFSSSSGHSMSRSHYSSNNNNSTAATKGELFSDTDEEVADTLSRARSQEGYHSDTNASSQDDSASQHSGGTVPRTTNPLSSFIAVPAPPPHYQHPQAKVRITAPTFSPLKRGQAGPPGRGRAQPMPVITPKAPDVTYRGVGDGNSPGSTVRTFSAEDLNAEMMHLEGLMKDLNAITQSELQN